MTRRLVSLVRWIRSNAVELLNDILGRLVAVAVDLALRT
jgi:hypothetical protein